MFGQIGGQQGIGGPLSSDSIGGENFIRHIGNDKLIFDFHEGSGITIRDKSHCGNDGTLGTGAATPTWKRNSLYFDGGDHVDLTGINHGISTGEFTFCFYLSNWNAGKYIFRQVAIAFYLYTVAAGTITFYSGANKFLSDDVSSLTDMFIQIVRDSSGNLECYINDRAENKGESDSSDLTYDGTSQVRMALIIKATLYNLRICNKRLSEIEGQKEYLVNKFAGNN